MGDIFSKKINSTTNLTENHQVTLQGGAEGSTTLGVSSSAFDHSILNVQSGDYESVAASRDVALATLKNAGIQSNDAAILGIAATQLGQSALDVSKKSFDTADKAITGSQQSLSQVLEAMQAVQKQSGAIEEKSLSAALEIAKTAAPVSPGDYALAVTGGATDLTQRIIFGMLLLVGTLAVTYITKKK